MGRAAGERVERPHRGWRPEQAAEGRQLWALVVVGGLGWRAFPTVLAIITACCLVII